MRRLAALLACALPSVVLAQSAQTRDGEAVARFEAPTDRYGHDVLGGLPEWGRLCLEIGSAGACVTLPESAVFEDIAPRLGDVTGNGRPDAVVVESSVTGGAALVVYTLNDDRLTRIATPEIGRRNRWLAPVGLADFDGDGRLDIAYVETPHLGKILMIWSMGPNGLEQLIRVRGVTNHRIGEDFITSAIHDCKGIPTIALADAGWRRVMAVSFADGDWRLRDVAPFSTDTIADPAKLC